MGVIHVVARAAQKIISTKEPRKIAVGILCFITSCFFVSYWKIGNTHGE